MTVIDHAAIEPSPSKHGPLRTGRRTGRLPLDVAAGVFLVAVAVITFHVFDALLRQAPTRLEERVGECTLGLLVCLLIIVTFLRSDVITRGVLAVLVGILAAIEASGIAVAHTIKGAAAGSDTAGLASAAAALTLIVLGSILVLGRIAGWRRWLARALPC